ncbi:hypothetical protein NMY22_g14934 [Coprinellus aureogranulatus]|nr:hypothetical protein NMY22_g14934 [Coprinellus aureogranulatus]
MADGAALKSITESPSKTGKLFRVGLEKSRQEALASARLVTDLSVTWLRGHLHKRRVGDSLTENSQDGIHP